MSKSKQFGLSDFFPPAHREGRVFIFVGLVIALLGFVFIGSLLGWAGIAFVAFCFFFFRNPDREVPQIEGGIVSPADGRVCAIVDADWPHELGPAPKDVPYKRISIFLSVLDVHVNRSPAQGQIAKIAYVPGKMLNANWDKASEENERNLISLDRPGLPPIAFVQISGFVARRIICDVAEGDDLEAGERFGIIRFGSRMDVFVPNDMVLCVALGQRTLGGETLLALPAEHMFTTDPVPVTCR